MAKKTKKAMEVQVAWLQEFGLERGAAAEYVQAFNFRLQNGKSTACVMPNADDY